jgi:hypothetical protein
VTQRASVLRACRALLVLLTACSPGQLHPVGGPCRYAARREPCALVALEAEVRGDQVRMTAAWRPVARPLATPGPLPGLEAVQGLAATEYFAATLEAPLAQREALRGHLLGHAVAICIVDRIEAGTCAPLVVRRAVVRPLAPPP